MMKINFTEKEISDIKNIIDRYRNVSGDLLIQQKKAEKIQEKVTKLQNKLKEIKTFEDDMMEELHTKYGNFSIQDIYETLYIKNNEQ